MNTATTRIWNEVALGEIVTLHYGKALPRDQRNPQGSIPVYGANGVKDTADRYHAEGPSLVIGRKGSAGQVTRVDGPFWPLDVTYFTSHDQSRLDFEFLKYALDVLHLPNLARGVKPGINRNDVYTLRIPLPPLEEQHRIVAILDETFGGLNRIQAHAEVNIVNLDELYQSIVQKAFSRGLTESGSRSLWNEVMLGDVLDIQNGAAFKSTLFSETDGIPLIRIRDLRNGYKTTTSYTGDYDSQYIVNSGDFLIGMDGEFKCYEWKGYQSLLNQRVCKLVNISETVRPRFLFYGINRYLEEIEKNTAFTTVKHLSSKTVKSIVFHLPSLQEQEEIVNVLDSVVSNLTKARCQVEARLKDITEFRQSLLQRAFAGELT